MRVYVYPADVQGCGTVRLIWVSRYLKSQGYDVELVLPKDPGTHKLRSVLKGSTVINASYPKDADVIVMQRTTSDYTSQAVALMRVAGIAVVIDIDDDLGSVPTSNPAWMMVRGSTTSGGQSDTYLRNACRDATMVTVSTDTLAPIYGAHGRVRVLRNRIPAWYLTLNHRDSTTVGWGGVVATHGDDLQQTGSAVRQHIETGGKFHVVGPPEGVAKALALNEQGWTYSGVVTDITEWPYHLTYHLGVGIAPLADTRFNQAKSYLKILEYSATGVPWVASPREEYARFHAEQPSAGFLARKPREWSRHIKALTTDEALRRETGESARDLASRHTVEGGAHLWWEAWSDAYAMQSGHARESRIIT